MKGYISIIYVNTHTLSEEKVAVGGISVFDKGVDIFFSDQKLDFALKLMKGKNKKFILQNINLFKSKIFDIKAQLSTDGPIEPSAIKSEIFDKNYLSYLHNYSQGVLGFGAPKPVNIAKGSEDYCFNLVKTFVGNLSEGRINRLRANSNLLIGSISLNAVHYTQDCFFLEKIFDQNSPAEYYELAYLCEQLLQKLHGKAKIRLTVKTTFDLENDSNLKDLFRLYHTGFYQVDAELIKSERVEIIDLDEMIRAFNLENRHTKLSS